MSGKVIFIYLLGLGRSRMVAGKPFFFKSDHGRDMQGTLPSRPSKQTGGRGILWFSLSLHLLGLASSLGWERGWVGALPLLYSYWLRTSGCCLGAQEREWKEWAQNKTVMWGRQTSYFKKENGKLSKNCASKDNVSKCTESPGVVAIRKNEMTFLYTQSNLIGVWCCT